jgi:hypothetical protein
MHDGLLRVASLQKRPHRGPHLPGLIRGTRESPLPQPAATWVPWCWRGRPGRRHRPRRDCPGGREAGHAASTASQPGSASQATDWPVRRSGRPS